MHVLECEHGLWPGLELCPSSKEAIQYFTRLGSLKAVTKRFWLKPTLSSCLPVAGITGKNQCSGLNIMCSVAIDHHYWLHYLVSFSYIARDTFGAGCDGSSINPSRKCALFRGFRGFQPAELKISGSDHTILVTWIRYLLTQKLINIQHFHISFKT